MALSKNLPPSSRKLRKAREDGDVAKSKDLSSAVVLTSGICTLLYLAPRTLLVIDLMQKSFAGARDFQSNNMLVYARHGWELLLSLLLPVLLVVFFAALSVEVLQVGLKFSFKPLGFKPSRLGFFRGLKRIFGFRENNNEGGLPCELLFNISKIVSCLAVFGLVLAVAIAVFTRASIGWQFVETQDVLSLLGFAIMGLSAGFLPLYLLIAGVDLLVQRQRRLKRLGMDIDELKRELRESEGDPETRGMRKQLHRELLAHGVLQGVRRAKLILLGGRS
jgi:type III secretion protein U